MSNKTQKILGAILIVIAVSAVVGQMSRQKLRSNRETVVRVPSSGAPDSSRKSVTDPGIQGRIGRATIVGLGPSADPDISGIPADKLAALVDKLKTSLAQLSPIDPRDDFGADIFVSELLKYAPEDAIQWVFSQPSQGIYEDSYRYVGEYLGRLGYDQVADRLKNLKPDKAFLVTKGAVDGLGFTSPLQAIELKLRTEKETGKRLSWFDDGMYRNAIRANHTEEAIFAVQTLYSGVTRDNELGSLYNVWVRTSGEQAANDLLSRSFPKATQSVVLRSLLSNWRNNDGEVAMKKWMKTLGSDKLQLVQHELRWIAEN